MFSLSTSPTSVPMSPRGFTRQSAVCRMARRQCHILDRAVGFWGYKFHWSIIKNCVWFGWSEVVGGSRWFVLCNKRRLRELCNSFRNIDGLSKVWMNIVDQGCHVSNESVLFCF